jgi:hypothetical protein
MRPICGHPFIGAATVRHLVLSGRHLTSAGMSQDGDHPRNPPEHPRSEPEILPPERGWHDRAGSGDASREAYVWTSRDGGGAQRIYIARPGPFSIAAALVIVGLVLAAIVLLLLGLVLFWVPVIVLVVAALLLAGYVRSSWRRLQLWMSRR